MNRRQKCAKLLTERTVAVLAAVIQAGQPHRLPGLLHDFRAKLAGSGPSAFAADHTKLAVLRLLQVAG